MNQMQTSISSLANAAVLISHLGDNSNLVAHTNGSTSQIVRISSHKRKEAEPSGNEDDNDEEDNNAKMRQKHDTVMEMPHLSEGNNINFIVNKISPSWNDRNVKFLRGNILKRQILRKHPQR